MNPKKPRTPCKRCGTEPARSSQRYCSNACQMLFAFEERYAEWLAGGQPWVHNEALRSALIKRDGRRCDSCKETQWLGQPIPLEVNHKDGNHKNCGRDNVHLLCPNCHALTPNYRALNRGNGRQKRRDEYRARNKKGPEAGASEPEV